MRQFSCMSHANRSSVYGDLLRKKSHFAVEVFAVAKAMAQHFGHGVGRVLLRTVGLLTESHSNERSSPAAASWLTLVHYTHCFSNGAADYIATTFGGLLVLMVPSEFLRYICPTCWFRSLAMGVKRHEFHPQPTWSGALEPGGNGECSGKKIFGV